MESITNIFSNKKVRDEVNRKAYLGMIYALEEHPKRDPYDALIFAAMVGEKDEFFRLYEKFDPEINWTDEYGNDLVQHAVTGEEITIVQYLIKKGHLIDHPGRYQITPLIRACSQVAKSKCERLYCIY